MLKLKTPILYILIASNQLWIIDFWKVPIHKKNCPGLNKMEEKYSSFTVTLQSNLERDNFPLNSNFSFSSSLPKPMDLSGYKIALQSILFTDSYEKPSFKPQIIKVDDNKNCFNTFLLDDRILAQSSTRSRLMINKVPDNYTNFMDYVKTGLMAQNMHCEVIPTFTEGKITKIAIKFKPPSGYQISFAHPINRLLGLSTTILHEGEYENDIDENYYNSYYESLHDGFMGNIILYAYNSIEIQLEQLQGRQTANSVINHIVSTLLENDIDASMIIHPSNNALEFTILPEDTRVVLSSFINDFLGIRPDFSFENSGTVILSPKNIEIEEIENFLFEDEEIFTSSKILVLCDIIQNQFYGGQKYPLLHLLDRYQRTNVQSGYTINPLVYKNVEVSYASHISISIKSDRNEFNPYSKSPSVVCVHLRRKYPGISNV